MILVSGGDVKLELDTLPFVVLSSHKIERQSPLPEIIVGNEGLTDVYSAYLAIFHPEIFEELKTMASRTPRRKPDIDVARVIEVVGADKILMGMDAQKIVDKLGVKKVIELMDVDRKKQLLTELINEMSPAEAARLRRRLEAK